MRIQIESITIRAAIIPDDPVLTKLENVTFQEADLAKLPGDITTMFKLAKSYVFYNVVDKPAQQ